MFLAAVARPRKVWNGVWFDGKIGLGPIMDTVLAERDSNIREKGSPITKPVTVNGKRYKDLMIEEVIPSIKARTPRPSGHTLFA
ncbi:unnamed protein product [Discosporangium mesarthrocarpum]